MRELDQMAWLCNTTYSRECIEKLWKFFSVPQIEPQSRCIGDNFNCCRYAEMVEHWSVIYTIFPWTFFFCCLQAKHCIVVGLRSARAHSTHACMAWGTLWYSGARIEYDENRFLIDIHTRTHERVTNIEKCRQVAVCCWQQNLILFTFSLGATLSQSRSEALIDISLIANIHKRSPLNTIWVTASLSSDEEEWWEAGFGYQITTTWDEHKKIYVLQASPLHFERRRELLHIIYICEW